MMKIFAIRDRLLDYYQRPMVFDRAPDLMAALAKAINSTEGENEIQQAPEQFELWQLGEVDDQGNLKAERQLIINCASLIRNGVWTRTQRGSRQTDGEAPGSAQPAGRSPTADSGSNGSTAVQDGLEPTQVQAQPIGGGPGRGPAGRNR